MTTASEHHYRTFQDCVECHPETIDSWRRVKTTLKVWFWRHKVRSQLRAELPLMDIARVEKDTGLPTGALRQEAAKPFWKA